MEERRPEIKDRNFDRWLNAVIAVCIVIMLTYMVLSK